MSILTRWENFYAIIGTAASALNGLVFVVVTMIYGVRQQRRNSDAFTTFNTPTVIHFCATLLIATILSAPWPMLWSVALLLGLIGLSGVVYVSIILRRMRRQPNYTPVLEDWVWNVIFPFASYIALVFAAVLLINSPELSLFIVAAVTVLLLFIGIHNSWDNVTYIAVELISRQDS